MVTRYYLLYATVAAVACCLWCSACSKHGAASGAAQSAAGKTVTAVGDSTKPPLAIKSHQNEWPAAILKMPAGIRLRSNKYTSADEQSIISTAENLVPYGKAPIDLWVYSFECTSSQDAVLAQLHGELKSQAWFGGEFAIETPAGGDAPATAMHQLYYYAKTGQYRVEITLISGGCATADGKLVIMPLSSTRGTVSIRDYGAASSARVKEWREFLKGLPKLKQDMQKMI